MIILLHFVVTVKMHQVGVSTGDTVFLPGLFLIALPLNLHQGKLELHEKQKQVSEGRGKLSKKICFNYIRQKDDQDRLHTSSTYKMKKKMVFT